MAHPQRPWLDLEGAAVGLIGGVESSTRCFGEVRLMECPADVGASRSAVSNTISKLPIHSHYHEPDAEPFRFFLASMPLKVGLWLLVPAPWSLARALASGVYQREKGGGSQNSTRASQLCRSSAP